VVAVVGAAAIGQEVDGGLLIVIFATSGALEAVVTPAGPGTASAASSHLLPTAPCDCSPTVARSRSTSGS
jgi:hypothetical protein